MVLLIISGIILFLLIAFVLSCIVQITPEEREKQDEEFYEWAKTHMKTK